MAGSPQIRSAWLKYIVRYVKVHPGPEGERLRAEFPPDLRARIRSEGRLGWSDAALFAELCNFLAATGGAGVAREVWKRSFEGSFEQPLMRPITHAALALLGNNPGALVRRTPDAWKLMARNCGKMTAERGPEPNSVVFRVVHLPRALRTLAFTHMMEGGFQAQIEHVGAVGEVYVDSADLRSEGQASCTVRWKRL